MPTRKPEGPSRSIDSDDAPPLDREWFERAEIREGKRLIRPAKAAGRREKAMRQPEPGAAR